MKVYTDLKKKKKKKAQTFLDSKFKTYVEIALSNLICPTISLEK